MQASTAPSPTQPPPPSSATTNPSPAAIVTSGGTVIQVPGAPVTQAEITALRARRREISNQLESAASRRSRLAQQLDNAEGSSRQGLEERIRVLDERIVQLETDLAVTGRQLAAAPAALVGTTSAQSAVFGLESGQITGISIVFTLFVLAPLAFAAARTMLKRANRPAPPAIPHDTVVRMERIEQAVDAIAIEVERISEGQRFVTRLLSDPDQAAALAPGSAQRPEQARVAAARTASGTS